MDRPIRIAIFASGGGSNARSIMQHFQNSEVASVVLLGCNRKSAGAFSHASEFNIASWHFTKDDLQSDAVLEKLKSFEIDLLVLAGFLLMVPESLVKAFPDRILNIHPALLPRYGGEGMYGMNVHKAVKTAGDSFSGTTIHLVNEHYDEGEILFQATTELTPDDTAESIAAKVLVLEHRYYPQVIESFCKTIV
ncbi:MAG: phosphoribosylglycinamide formyltransferase [Cryomorphaceae bacterium]|nr:phosphoribosylglycinamide formyltransferase [Cryomorphaceae bacterium]